ncbi:Hypothetical predicted protein [Mytilus galloprovincialis]|uniref:Reverse transcriptase/retrotransposon-derived protein RNase H-like domain-containing protein n=1 Tax=Mytilus galloprovincialis TaxID=29158 RepID=A0A8B6GNF8_MYTGA|nr:Hypothetical predicted protein [Mytilus galloprovincialis]
MASSTRAPKQWCLTKIETVNTFENWRQNLIYTLSLDKNFAPFLVSGTKWEKKTKTTTHRGFANDGEEVPEANRKTREQKRYGTELRARTLASIKPEISQALESLLEELRTTEDAKSMRAAVKRFPKTKQSSFVPRSNFKSCPLCKSAGRPDRHFLSQCTYLPQQDRQFMAKAHNHDNNDSTFQDQFPVASNRVQIQQSPYIDAYYGHNPTRLTIDSGATGNMIRASAATKLNAKITSSSQSAHQADGSSPLTVVGETRLTFTRDKHQLYFEGLVVENLDSDILAGIPFMEKNDISIRPARRQSTCGTSTIRRHNFMARRLHRCKIPNAMVSTDDIFFIEPHKNDSYENLNSWPEPSLVSSVAGNLRIPNLTDEPLVLKRNEHFCNVRSQHIHRIIYEIKSPDHAVATKSQLNKAQVLHSDLVRVDPDGLLQPCIKEKFKSLLRQYDNVFSPTFKGYNGAVGALEAKVNMGPVQPPQRKGRIPQYSKTQLVTLQEKFNELEDIGVFKKPEDIGVTVEYLNPSFLIKKPNGGFRLVTAFADVGRYSKPQPSLMPDVDSTLRQIAQWKHIVISDLTKSFYQIPLHRDSMKYCGVSTPFCGVRVYVRSAMGMPGSETALEELTCRVLGHLVQEGVVAKIADDLYCGGNSPEELLTNWERVLQALQKCSLNLSATKTIIAPKQATILGWIWELGSIRASPHRIATLSNCQPPKTVRALRSFVGAYKVLSRVIKNSSGFLSLLENAVARSESKDTILWTEELNSAFTSAQNALSTNRSIALPRPNDQLWIVTDGALKTCGLGATLYINRNDKLLLAGFFSAKLRQAQRQWLPCEIEALSIAGSIKHFSPYIIQRYLQHVF